ncbi:BI1-like protein [Trifolium medium]|uniref:BI1-like protein n=1 Tax=Trifolium medium TaxID=97028 RepID=A0A392MLD2_9FABA|nr:BI1-like protein [Trifolium medium]
MSRKINSESLEGVHENLERSLCPTKLENLERSVCPTTMLENPQLRWSFIRKVYSIITFQFFLITVAVSIGVFLRSVSNFFIKTTQGFVLYVVLIFVPFLAMYPLYYYYDRKHPLSYLLLLIFNVSSAIPVGLTCAFVSEYVNFDGFLVLSQRLFFAIAASPLSNTRFCLSYAQAIVAYWLLLCFIDVLLMLLDLVQSQ